MIFFPFVIFMFLIVAFSFPLREVPLTFLFLINLFIYFWLCWVFVAVCGLLIAVAPLVVDHGL